MHNFLYKLLYSEQCLQSRANSGDVLPDFKDYDTESGITRINRSQQAIVPLYKFQCCGNITGWEVDVEPDGRKHRTAYDLDLQVWRPSPTVGDSTTESCVYSLVKNNPFTSSSLVNKDFSVTPPPGDYIQFQPGDVLGFYVERAGANNEGVVALTTGSYSSYSVWLGSIASPNMNTIVTIGNNGGLSSLLHGAPVITISTSEPYSTAMHG